MSGSGELRPGSVAAVAKSSRASRELDVPVGSTVLVQEGPQKPGGRLLVESQSGGRFWAAASALRFLAGPEREGAPGSPSTLPWLVSGAHVRVQRTPHVEATTPETVGRDGTVKLVVPGRAWVHVRFDAGAEAVLLTSDLHDAGATGDQDGEKAEPEPTAQEPARPRTPPPPPADTNGGAVQGENGGEVSASPPLESAALQMGDWAVLRDSAPNRKLHPLLVGRAGRVTSVASPVGKHASRVVALSFVGKRGAVRVPERELLRASRTIQEVAEVEEAAALRDAEQDASTARGAVTEKAAPRVAPADEAQPTRSEEGGRVPATPPAAVLSDAAVKAPAAQGSDASLLSAVAEASMQTPQRPPARSAAAAAGEPSSLPPPQTGGGQPQPQPQPQPQSESSSLAPTPTAQRPGRDGDSGAAGPRLSDVPRSLWAGLAVRWAGVVGVAGAGKEGGATVEIAARPRAGDGAGAQGNPREAPVEEVEVLGDPEDVEEVWEGGKPLPCTSLKRSAVVTMVSGSAAGACARVRERRVGYYLVRLTGVVALPCGDEEAPDAPSANLNSVRQRATVEEIREQEHVLPHTLALRNGPLRFVSANALQEAAAGQEGSEEPAPHPAPATPTHGLPLASAAQLLLPDGAEGGYLAVRLKQLRALGNGRGGVHVKEAHNRAATRGIVVSELPRVALTLCRRLQGGIRTQTPPAWVEPAASDAGKRSASTPASAGASAVRAGGGDGQTDRGAGARRRGKPARRSKLGAAGEGAAAASASGAGRGARMRPSSRASGGSGGSNGSGAGQEGAPGRSGGVGSGGGGSSGSGMGAAASRGAGGRGADDGLAVIRLGSAVRLLDGREGTVVGSGHGFYEVRLLADSTLIKKRREQLHLRGAGPDASSAAVGGADTGGGGPVKAEAEGSSPAGKARDGAAAAAAAATARKRPRSRPSAGPAAVRKRKREGAGAAGAARSAEACGAAEDEVEASAEGGGPEGNGADGGEEEAPPSLSEAVPAAAPAENGEAPAPAMKEEEEEEEEVEGAGGGVEGDEGDGGEGEGGQDQEVEGEGAGAGEEGSGLRGRPLRRAARVSIEQSRQQLRGTPAQRAGLRGREPEKRKRPRSSPGGAAGAARGRGAAAAAAASPQLLAPTLGGDTPWPLVGEAVEAQVPGRAGGRARTMRLTVRQNSLRRWQSLRLTEALTLPVGPVKKRGPGLAQVKHARQRLVDLNQTALGQQLRRGKDCPLFVVNRAPPPPPPWWARPAPLAAAAAEKALVVGGAAAEGISGVGTVGGIAKGSHVRTTSAPVPSRPAFAAVERSRTSRQRRRLAMSASPAGGDRATPTGRTSMASSEEEQREEQRARASKAFEDAEDDAEEDLAHEALQEARRGLGRDSSRSAGTPGGEVGPMQPMPGSGAEGEESAWDAEAALLRRAEQQRAFVKKHRRIATALQAAKARVHGFLERAHGRMLSEHRPNVTAWKAQFEPSCLGEEEEGEEEDCDADRVVDLLFVPRCPACGAEQEADWEWCWNAECARSPLQRVQGERRTGTPGGAAGRGPGRDGVPAPARHPAELRRWALGSGEADEVVVRRDRVAFFGATAPLRLVGVRRRPLHRCERFWELPRKASAAAVHTPPGSSEVEPLEYRWLSWEPLQVLPSDWPVRKRRRRRSAAGGSATGRSGDSAGDTRSRTTAGGCSSPAQGGSDSRGAGADCNGDGDGDGDSGVAPRRDQEGPVGGDAPSEPSAPAVKAEEGETATIAVGEGQRDVEGQAPAEGGAPTPCNGESGGADAAAAPHSASVDASTGSSGGADPSASAADRDSGDGGRETLQGTSQAALREAEIRVEAAEALATVGEGLVWPPAAAAAAADGHAAEKVQGPSADPESRVGDDAEEGGGNGSAGERPSSHAVAATDEAGEPQPPGERAGPASGSREQEADSRQGMEEEEEEEEEEVVEDKPVPRMWGGVHVVLRAASCLQELSAQGVDLEERRHIRSSVQDLRGKHADRVRLDGAGGVRLAKRGEPPHAEDVFDTRRGAVSRGEAVHVEDGPLPGPASAGPEEQAGPAPASNGVSFHPEYAAGWQGAPSRLPVPMMGPGPGMGYVGPYSMAAPPYGYSPEGLGPGPAAGADVHPMGPGDAESGGSVGDSEEGPAAAAGRRRRSQRRRMRSRARGASEEASLSDVEGELRGGKPGRPTRGRAPGGPGPGRHGPAPVEGMMGAYPPAGYPMAVGMGYAPPPDFYGSMGMGGYPHGSHPMAGYPGGVGWVPPPVSAAHGASAAAAAASMSMQHAMFTPPMLGPGVERGLPPYPHPHPAAGQPGQEPFPQHPHASVGPRRGGSP